MAKKIKCTDEEMLSWVSVVKECGKLQPDPSKITLPQVKSAVKTVFAEGEGCYTKPIPPKSAIKEMAEYKKAAEEKIGKKFKELY